MGLGDISIFGHLKALETIQETRSTVGDKSDSSIPDCFVIILEARRRRRACASSRMPRYQVSSTSPVNSESSLEPPVFLTPVDVDPRSWFSNERTCIEWLHSAGILGAFAAGLVTTNEQPARIAGIGLMIPAVFVVIHAARMQAKRSKQLDARAIDSHFDRVGPTLLTFLLSLSLLANLTLSIDRTFFSGRAYEPNSPGAGRISPLQYFYTTAGVLALGIATAVTLPAHLGGAEGASLTSSTLGQPFLELEPRAVNHGPVRPKLLYANERACIPWSDVSSEQASDCR